MFKAFKLALTYLVYPPGLRPTTLQPYPLSFPSSLPLSLSVYGALDEKRPGVNYAPVASRHGQPKQIGVTARDVGVVWSHTHTHTHLCRWLSVLSVDNSDSVLSLRTLKECKGAAGHCNIPSTSWYSNTLFVNLCYVQCVIVWLQLHDECVWVTRCGLGW